MATRIERNEYQPLPDDVCTITDWTESVQSEAEWVRKRVALRVGQPSEVDDVTQEVLLAAIQCPPSEALRGGIRPWLYRLIVRRVADHFRRRSSEVRQTEQYAAQFFHPAPWTEREDSFAELNRAIKRLSPETRELLRLKFESGWSYRRLADFFETTERKIEYRLLRAKQEIRKTLASFTSEAQRVGESDE
ncbi:MAG: RNA polymerase sigma factor [Planctomycetota bacterium]